MFAAPTLSEAMRVADNKSKYLQMTGTPMDRVNWMDAEMQAQQMLPPSPAPMQPAPAPGRFMQPPGFAAGGLVSRSVAPMGSSAPGTGLPGSFWDENTKSWVVGIDTQRGKENYFKARGGPTWSGGAIQNGQEFRYGGGQRFGMGGGAPPGQTIGGRMPGPMGGGGGGTGADPFSQDTVFDPVIRKYVPRFAEGGEVDGPGGPKDDLVPAMLSDGEFIIPADAVRRIGTDRLEKMIEPPDLDKKPKPAAPAMHGGMMHMAAGGFVNPYADNPEAAVRRSEEMRLAMLAQSGIEDMGGGLKRMENRYGTGMAMPASSPVASAGPGQFNMGGDAATMVPGRGAAMVPDFIPAGPWSNGAAPFDAQANRENIAFLSQQMESGAGGRRSNDLAAKIGAQRFIPSGPSMITVPDATWEPQPGTGNREPGTRPFLSPSEKDAQAAAARDAPIQPFLDAGMKRRDIREMMRTPRGIQALQDMQPEQWTPIPGTDYLQGRRGNTVPMSRASQPVAVPPGMEAESMTVNGVRYAKPKDAKGAAGGIHATKEIDGVLYNMTKTGDLQRAPIKDPTPTVKAKVFKHVTGRKPQSEEDWTEAHYLTTGDERKQAAPAREFKTPEEAMKAGLKPGDRVMVGGRMATWK